MYDHGGRIVFSHVAERVQLRRRSDNLCKEIFLQKVIKENASIIQRRDVVQDIIEYDAFACTGQKRIGLSRSPSCGDVTTQKGAHIIPSKLLLPELCAVLKEWNFKSARTVDTQNCSRSRSGVRSREI